MRIMCIEKKRVIREHDKVLSLTRDWHQKLKWYTGEKGFELQSLKKSLVGCWVHCRNHQRRTNDYTKKNKQERKRINQNKVYERMIYTWINWRHVATDKRRCNQKIGAESGENELWGVEGGHTHHPCLVGCMQNQNC